MEHNLYFIVTGVLLFCCVGSSCYQRAPLGDRFESFPYNPELERAHHEAYLHTQFGFTAIAQITSDLANTGNILVLTNTGVLYTTTDHQNFSRLNTEYNISFMPRFIQTPTKFMFVSINNSDCLCQLYRASRKILPVHTSTTTYVICEQSCNDMMIGQHLDRPTFHISFDTRNESFAFSVRKTRDSKFQLKMRHFALVASERQVGSSSDAETHFPMTYVDIKVKFLADHIDYDSFEHFEQFNSHIYTYSNKHDAIFCGVIPPLRDFGLNMDMAVELVKIDESRLELIDQTFRQTLYNWPKNLARINSTTLAIADKYNSKLRLFDVRTNTTRPLCMAGIYGIYSTCNLAFIDGVHFTGDSLYLTWTQGWGRIEHVGSATALPSEQLLTDSATSPVVTSAVSASLMGLLFGSSITLCLRTRCRRSSRQDKSLNSRSEFTSEDISMPPASRPLPQIAGKDDNSECYDMPYLNDEDVYDMIGDEDYDVIQNIDLSELGEHKSSQDEHVQYADNSVIAYKMCPTSSGTQSICKLDSNGYLEPIEQHSL